MRDVMTIDRFAERLDALGYDLARWPDIDAAEGHALLARSGEARDLHARARRLDEFVAGAAAAAAPNGLVFRIVADVASRRADRLSWLFGSPRRLGMASAAFCAVALALGVALGAAGDPARAGQVDLGLGSAFSLSIADGDF